MWYTSHDVPWSGLDLRAQEAASRGGLGGHCIGRRRRLHKMPNGCSGLDQRQRHAEAHTARGAPIISRVLTKWHCTAEGIKAHMAVGACAHADLTSRWKTHRGKDRRGRRSSYRCRETAPRREEIVLKTGMQNGARGLG